MHPTEEDDTFEKQLRADIKAGKFDRLIAAIIAEDETGETVELEAVCNL